MTSHCFKWRISSRPSLKSPKLKLLSAQPFSCAVRVPGFAVYSCEYRFPVEGLLKSCFWKEVSKKRSTVHQAWEASGAAGR